MEYVTRMSFDILTQEEGRHVRGSMGWVGSQKLPRDVRAVLLKHKRIFDDTSNTRLNLKSNFNSQNIKVYAISHLALIPKKALSFFFEFI